MAASSRSPRPTITMVAVADFKMVTGVAVRAPLLLLCQLLQPVAINPADDRTSIRC